MMAAMGYWSCCRLPGAADFTPSPSAAACLGPLEHGHYAALFLPKAWVGRDCEPPFPLCLGPENPGFRQTVGCIVVIL